MKKRHKDIYAYIFKVTLHITDKRKEIRESGKWRKWEMMEKVRT
jgi:hypothetical protein